MITDWMWFQSVSTWCWLGVKIETFDTYTCPPSLSTPRSPSHPLVHRWPLTAMCFPVKSCPGISSAVYSSCRFTLFQLQHAWTHEWCGLQCQQYWVVHHLTPHEQDIFCSDQRHWGRDDWLSWWILHPSTSCCPWTEFADQPDFHRSRSVRAAGSRLQLPCEPPGEFLCRGSTCICHSTQRFQKVRRFLTPLHGCHTTSIWNQTLQSVFTAQSIFSKCPLLALYVIDHLFFSS